MYLEVVSDNGGLLCCSLAGFPGTRNLDGDNVLGLRMPALGCLRGSNLGESGKASELALDRGRGHKEKGDTPHGADPGLLSDFASANISALCRRHTGIMASTTAISHPSKHWCTVSGAEKDRRSVHETLYCLVALQHASVF